jgi:O-antigen/teichoic acid export membrane protein
MGTIVKSQVTKSGRPSGTKVRPFFHDLGLTAVTEFTVLVAAILLVSIFGRILGAAALGEYLLLRRVVSWLQGVVQLGLGTALTRYVAHAVHKQDGTPKVYFLITLGISLLATMTLGITFWCLKPIIARLLFGSVAMRHLIMPLTLMLFGLAMHAAVYGYYRGYLSMHLANGVEFCNLAVAPLLSITLLSRTQSVAAIVNLIGIVMCLFSTMFALPIFLLKVKNTVVDLRLRAAEMLNYALPRFVGDVSLGGLMALPPIIASHYVAMNRLAYLLLGASMLTVFGTSVTPIGIILLSKASMMLALGRAEDLRTRLDYLVAAVLELSVFGCLQLVVFADVVIRVWVGPSFIQGTLVVRLLLLAVPFYVFYVALRSVVDAVSVIAYNTRNLLMVLGGLLIFVPPLVVLVPTPFVLDSIALAWVGSLAALGWLTARTLRKLLGLSINFRRMLAPISVAVILAGANLVVHWIDGFQTSILLVLLLEGVSFAIFLACLRKLGPWVPYVWKALFQNSSVTDLSLADS